MGGRETGKTKMQFKTIEEATAYIVMLEKQLAEMTKLNDIHWRLAMAQLTAMKERDDECEKY